MSSITGYCSWCYKKTSHFLINKSLISRNSYKCSNCLNGTVICRYCSDFARGKPSPSMLSKKDLKILANLTNSWNNELCAVHDGSIANFDNLDLKIDDITDYKKIFIREKSDLLKLGKKAGLGVTGVLAVAGVVATSGGGAAPIAAALGKMGLLGATASGTAISSLSGAALTSASLAAIGGTVAAGTMIISASGLALGGVVGGVVANKYYSEDKSFEIRKLQSFDSERNVIFINGFTQENDTKFEDWLSSQNKYSPECNIYGVNWSSKTNMQLGTAFAGGVGKESAKNMVVKIAASGGKKAAKGLSPISWFLFLAELASNPWHTSMLRAAQAGVQLAEAISRTEGKKFTLVGHSLGCRVIYYALSALSTKKRIFISDVILLGGAVGKDDENGWSHALKAISGKLFNCHTNQDSVLKLLYQTANAGLSSPIGINKLELSNVKVTNINCDSFVESHMSWKKNYYTILKLIENQI